MTRLAILSDVHADDYPGIPGRFDEILDTVRWVGRQAVAAGADALVCLGDYTESKQPARGPRVVKIAQAFAEGPARQIHVRGNHDGEWRGESIVTDLARTPGWSGYAVPDFELVGDVAVCVIPFLHPAWLRTQPGFELLSDADVYRALAETYVVIAAGLYAQAMAAGAGAAILVGHQQLAGGRMTESQQVFLGDLDTVVDTRALASIGYSAIVFGHVHRGQTVLNDPACPVLFAGSIERVDFAEEDETKSFVILEVDPSGLLPVRVERIPTPARRYLTLDFATDPTAGDDWPERVPGAVIRVLNVPPELETATMRRDLLAAGAHAVTQIRRQPAEAEAVTGGMDETLTAEQAVEAYFAGDADRDAMVALCRRLLAEAAA
jgi:exonuclease SbcD